MISIPTTVETVAPQLASVRLDARGGAQANDRSQSVSQEFDSVMLRQMLESILPDAKGGTFGGGTAGGIWRSMMADQISGVLSKSDVLGTSSIGLTSSDKSESGAKL